MSTATFKPRDVEEPVDYWVNRRLASVLVKALAPLPITPNQVTLLSGFAGLASGVVIATAPVGGGFQVPVAGLVLYLSILLDCADGQLARLRGESSMVGRFLDGCVDVVPCAAVFIGFATLLYRSGYDFWLINVVGWSAGYSLKWHVHNYDHAKNLYLANTRPASEGARALPTLDDIRREREALLARGDRVGAWILSGFVRFTNSQRQGWQRGRMGLGLRATRDDAERALYRERFAPTMRLWAWNGLGLHLVAWVLACFVTPLFHEASAALCFVILGPMNAYTAYIIWREKRIERALQHDLGLAPSTVDPARAVMP